MHTRKCHANADAVADADADADANGIRTKNNMPPSPSVGDIIHVITLFQEDNIFDTSACQTYGPQLQYFDTHLLLPL